MRSHVIATSLAALSLVQPTSGASSNATSAQLSAPDHSKYDALKVFERGKPPAGSVGSNIPKVSASPATATALSTSTTIAATKTTKTKAPEATESPDQAEIAAIEFYRLAYEGSRTDCDAKNDLRTACTNLIENAAGDAYPDWRNQTARGLRAYADPNTCFGDLMGLSGKQNSALIWMAGQLEAGEEVPTETFKKTLEERSQIAATYVPPKTGHGGSLVPSWGTMAAIGAGVLTLEPPLLIW